VTQEVRQPTAFGQKRTVRRRDAGAIRDHAVEGRLVPSSDSLDQTSLGSDDLRFARGGDRGRLRLASGERKRQRRTKGQQGYQKTSHVYPLCNFEEGVVKLE
jgi:hypothetical protein